MERTNFQFCRTLARMFVLVVWSILWCENSLAENQKPMTGKEILDKKDPRENSFKDFDQSKSMNDIIREFASNPALPEILKKMDEELNPDSERRLGEMSAAGQASVKTSGDRSQQVSEGINKSTQKKAAEMMAAQLGVKSFFEKGMEVDLIFGSKNSAVKNDGDKIRYGLVLEDLQPSEHHEWTAGPTKIQAEDLTFAPKAKVKWTIGPIKDQESFNKVDLPSESDSLESRLWRPEFKAKLSKKEGVIPAESSLVPPMVLGVFQAEKLYRVEYHTKENLEKEGIYQGITLPAGQQLKLDHEMDTNFKATKTSAKDIQLNSQGPKLDVHYLEQEERFQGDVNFSRTGYQLNLKAHSASPQKNEGPKYEMGITTDF